IVHQRAEPPRRGVDRRRHARGRLAPRLHLRAPQLRPERGHVGGIRRGPRRLDAGYRAGRAVRFRQGMGRAARAMAPVGRDRAHHEHHLDRGMRGRRALDHGGLGGLLLRVTPSFALAFVAGLLSFLSPCVLPLIPSYVGFLTGLTLEELEVRRGTALAHALWFVAGFSLIFIALGATASALALDRFLAWFQRFRPYLVWVERIAGGLLILLGLLLVTDRFTLLAGWLQGLTPEFLKSRL